MSWRIVVISRRAKLDLKLNHLVIRGDETLQVHLNEISQLIIECTAVSLTAVLLSELVNRKIKVIFCDQFRNPQAELLPYYGSHDSSNKLKMQIAWDTQIKEIVWTEIVTEKIKNQMKLLKKTGKEEYHLLNTYIEQIELNDITNREGHAAKVYFNAIYGMDFTRSSGDYINAALNYGYSILLSAFNREIVSYGYSTQLGLFHKNMFNHFNLSCDLIEPFRPLVDELVYKMDLQQFEKEEKMQLVNLLNSSIVIDGQKHYINNAIKIYCRSIFNALNQDDISEIKFFRNEL